MSREAAAALMCKLGCLTELLQSSARANVPTDLNEITQSINFACKASVNINTQPTLFEIRRLHFSVTRLNGLALVLHQRLFSLDVVCYYERFTQFTWAKRLRWRSERLKDHNQGVLNSSFIPYLSDFIFNRNWVQVNFMNGTSLFHKGKSSTALPKGSETDAKPRQKKKTCSNANIFLKLLVKLKTIFILQLHIV